MERPKRVRCPYCWTIVTGNNVGRTVYGWGCSDENRCVSKSKKATQREVKLRQQPRPIK